MNNLRGIINPEVLELLSDMILILLNPLRRMEAGINTKEDKEFIHAMINTIRIYHPKWRKATDSVH